MSQKQLSTLVEIPTPIKDPKEGQTVWYWEFNHNLGLEGESEELYILQKAKFKSSGYLLALCELGQLFPTKKGAEEFLKIMRKVRQ